VHRHAAGLELRRAVRCDLGVFAHGWWRRAVGEGLEVNGAIVLAVAVGIVIGIGGAVAYAIKVMMEGHR
jgi:hypothetical protein